MNILHPRPLFEVYNFERLCAWSSDYCAGCSHRLQA